MVDVAEGDLPPGQGMRKTASTKGSGGDGAEAGAAAVADDPTSFDPSPLLDTFQRTIHFLHNLNEKVAVTVRFLATRQHTT